MASGRLESETAKWTKTELDIFVDAMVEEVIKGDKTSSTFNKTGWENIKLECELKIGCPFTLRQLRNKMNKLRTDYGSFKRLLEQSGFGWCERTGMAETEDPAIWNDHIKANPSWEKFKKNGLSQWPQLCKIFVDSYATGAGGISNTQEHNVIERSFGAIDGTHVSTTVPKADQRRYFNRRGTTTQNFMCACSFDMKFTYVYCGWEGSANDCRIFHETLRNQAICFPHPLPGKYYVVDFGYSTMRGFMTPFKGERYHLQDYRGPRGTPRTPKELFNHHHSSLRNVIKRSFWVLKAWSPILKKMPAYPIKIQAYIVLVCCAVHNFIKDEQEADKLFERLRRYNVVDVEEHAKTVALGGHSIEVEQSGLHYGTAAEMNELKKSIANELARHHRMPEIPKT